MARKRPAKKGGSKAQARPGWSPAGYTQAPDLPGRDGASTNGAAPTPLLNHTKNVQALMSTMLRSQEFMRTAGMQYGGKRDIYNVAGYRPQGMVTFDDYWGIYTRGDIGGRIVDMPSKTTWRQTPTILEEGQPDKGTPFTQAFEKLAKRVRLWNYLVRVDRACGIGQYAVLFLGLRGAGSDASLAQPATKASGDDGKGLLYLSVYTQGNALIQTWENDPNNERFGLPNTYTLRTNKIDGMATATRPALLVHSSRLIHVAENVLEDDVLGKPRLERPLNRLFDLDKVAAGTGEAYWQLAAQILQAKIPADADITSDQLNEIDAQLEEMIHDLRRQFTAKGAELGWLPTQTPNVEQVANFYFSLIAGGAGIPKRILFGSEVGERASTQDEANFLGMIAERQVQFAEPVILRPFIDRCISLGILPEPKKGEYQVVWPPLSELTSLEQSELNLRLAQAAAALTPMGGNPRELVEVDTEGNIQLIERSADAPLDMEALLMPTPPAPPTDPNHPDPNAPPEAGGGSQQQPPAAKGSGGPGAEPGGSSADPSRATPGAQR